MSALASSTTAARINVDTGRKIATQFRDRLSAVQLHLSVEQNVEKIDRIALK